MSKPLLSVCLITYNHVAYIQQAIEGVLMQKTSFDFELIIADDCSNDGTTAIVKKFAEKHPGKIRPIIQEKNVGPGPNYLQLLQAAQGKYVAYLEGDDYWIDDSKLEQQVQFLEANPTYSLCFHDIYNLINGKRKRSSVLDAPDTSDINYLLSHTGYISTLTIVYRNSKNILELIEKLINCPFGDFATYVAAAQEGLIKRIPKKMGVYRVHDSGVWSTLGFEKAFKRTLIAYRMLFAELPAEQGEMLKIRYLVALEEYFLQGKMAYTDSEFRELLITEMKVEPYVIEYIWQNCQERKNPAHYISRVPFSILLKSVQHKLINKLA